MTIEEWRSTPGYVKAWRDTWNEPHMQAGLQVLLQLSLPKLVVPMSGDDAIKIAGLKFAQSAGYYDFMRNIEAMKTIPERVEQKDDVPGWGSAVLDSPPPDLAAEIDQNP